MTHPHPHDDATDCAFCDAFRCGTTHPNRNYLDEATGEPAEWILFQDPRVVVLPTLGPVTAGHTMVLTREHFLSFAHVPAELALYAEDVARELSDKLAAQFGGGVIWFEHGPMSESATGGACTSHAHLHCVPVGEIDISAQIDQRLSARPIDSFTALADQVVRDQAYLYYRSQRGEQRVYDVTTPLPCQFLRRITAAALGNDDAWDWMGCPRPELVLQTVNAVRW